MNEHILNTVERTEGGFFPQASMENTFGDWADLSWPNNIGF
jgi:hypothetical protein